MICEYISLYLVEISSFKPHINERMENKRGHNVAVQIYHLPDIKSFGASFSLITLTDRFDRSHTESFHCGVKH